MARWVWTTYGFWQRTADRMIFATVATLLSVLGTGQLDVIEADWETAFSLTAGAAIIAFLHSVLAERTPMPVSVEKERNSHGHREP